MIKRKVKQDPKKYRQVKTIVVVVVVVQYEYIGLANSIYIHSTI